MTGRSLLTWVMGNMGLIEDIETTFTDDALSVVRDASLVAEAAAKEFAPDGPTGLLKSSIRALDPVKTRDKIVGILTASARSLDGFDYATKQHDDLLHHAGPAPAGNKNFAEFGQAGSTQQKYRQGYYRRVGQFKRKGQRVSPLAPRYRTKFLDKGIEEAERVIK